MAETDAPELKPAEPAASPEAKSFASATAPAVMAARISFTIDTASGRAVTVEVLDDAGGRRELTAEEKIGLAKAGASDSLVDILEQTFEAGITAVLGEDGREEEEAESEDGANLRHLILRPMIARSAVKRFLKRDVLVRAIIGGLAQEVAQPDISDTEAAAAPTRPASPSSNSRRTAPSTGTARH
jgi:hypothetical protein